MAADVSFLVDLSIVIIIASAVSVILHRLHQPLVFGYLIAGIIISPFTQPLTIVQNVEAIRFLAELGIILLLFSLGLEFNIRKLRQLGLTPIFVASVKMLFLIAVGYYLGLLLGWSPADSLFLGAVLSISSTAIIVKAMMSMGRMHETSSQIMFGVLVVEDLAAVVMITLFTGLGVGVDFSLVEFGGLLLRIIIFVLVFLALGMAVVPRLIDYVAGFKIDELLVLTVLGLCFGMAFFTFSLGFSTATGAFLIGAVVAESVELQKIMRLTAPIRDVFAAVFFVSIGMLFDLSILTAMIGPLLLILAVMTLAKIFICGIASAMCGYDGKTSIQVGVGMTPIGEFSFIIAKLGRDLRLTSAFLFPVTVFAAVVTTLLTPYLVRLAPTLSDKLSLLAPHALKGYSSYFTVWMSKVRQSATGQVYSQVKTELTRMFIQVLVIAVIVVTVQTALGYLEGITGQTLLMPALAFLAIVVLSLPSIIKIVHGIGRLMAAMTETLLKSAFWNEAGPVRHVVKTLLLIFMATILGIAFVPFILLVSTTLVFQPTPFPAFAIPSPSAIPLILLGTFITALVGYLFQDHIRSLNRKLEDAFHYLFTHRTEGRGGSEGERKGEKQA